MSSNDDTSHPTTSGTASTSSGAGYTEKYIPLVGDSTGSRIPRAALDSGFKGHTTAAGLYLEHTVLENYNGHKHIITQGITKTLNLLWYVLYGNYAILMSAFAYLPNSKGRMYGIVE